MDYSRILYRAETVRRMESIKKEGLIKYEFYIIHLQFSIFILHIFVFQWIF